MHTTEPFANLQFFPTPMSLAIRALAMFRNQDFRRVIDTSAGEGDLLRALTHKLDKQRHSPRVRIDAIEIDLTKHPLLHAQGYSVVGMDFLKYQSLAGYSHVLMNPPFLRGAEHVLKAWDLLWDGEIVAILNAETLRNPCDKFRKRLVRLIQSYGEALYVGQPFTSPDAKIKTDVEVVMIRLHKQADIQKDIVGDILSNLKNEDAPDLYEVDETYRNAVALPNSTLENLVRCFNAAVIAMRESVIAESKRSYYQTMLGKSLTEASTIQDGNTESVKDVQVSLLAGYDDLKERGWNSVLHSSEIHQRLSSKAYQQLKAQFDQVKKMEFTVSNIYGFLLGLVESQGDMQMQMVCDVFDEITKYHSENRVYYRGWESNDKHRTAGFRIKTSRFILPRQEICTSGPASGTHQLLSDLDRVFALLDGKAEPDVKLAHACRMQSDELRDAQRVCSSYFDVRYYKGTGTMHFYPRHPKLIDRLNRMVGRQRGWLPPPDAPVHESFWLQYDQAETLDSQFHKTLARNARPGRDRPTWRIDAGTQEERDRAMDEINAALEQVHTNNGIEVKFEYLLAAADSPALLSGPEGCIAQPVQDAREQVSEFIDTLPTEFEFKESIPADLPLIEGGIILRTWEHRTPPTEGLTWEQHDSYLWLSASLDQMANIDLESLKKWTREQCRDDFNAILPVTQDDEKQLLLTSLGSEENVDLVMNMKRRWRMENFRDIQGLPYSTARALLEQTRSGNRGQLLQLPDVGEDQPGSIDIPVIGNESVMDIEAVNIVEIQDVEVIPVIAPQAQPKREPIRRQQAPAVDHQQLDMFAA
jgi:hypothetical protein